MDWAATITGLVLLQYRHLISLRNIFLIYVWALLILAPQRFGDPDESTAAWSAQFIALALVYVVSWHIGGLWPAGRRRRPATEGAVSPWSRTVDQVLAGIVAVLIALHCLIISTNVVRYGFGAFYSGAMLVDQIQNYGMADGGGAVYQIASFALTTLTNALVIFLVTRAYISRSGSTAASTDGSKTLSQLQVGATLRLCLAWFILVPLLQFSRSGLVFGAIAYVAARSFLRGRLVSIPMLVAVAMAISSFVVVGLARESRLGGTATAVDLFASELSPWVAYRDIRENIEFLGYQNGRTIVAPMVLKLVPRGLFPEKPHNSGGYYMTMMYPERFDAGFALPPTYLGDLFLNFGAAGVVVGTAVLGFFSGAVDVLTRRMPEKYLGFFLLVLLSYVGILRDALANSLFSVLSGLLAFCLLTTLASTLYALGPYARGGDIATAPTAT